MEEEEEEDEEEAAVRMESDCVRLESQMEGAGSQGAAGATASAMMCDSEEPLCRPPGKTDSPSKRKGEEWYIFYTCTNSQPVKFHWLCCQLSNRA